MSEQHDRLTNLRRAATSWRPQNSRVGGILILAFATVAALVWSFWLPAEHRYFNYETHTHGFNWDLRVYDAAGNNWALGMDPYGNQYQAPTVKYRRQGAKESASKGRPRSASSTCRPFCPPIAGLPTCRIASCATIGCT